MEELSSKWKYQEDLDDMKKKKQELDELKLKLQYTIMDLETFKREANEQIKEHSEEVKDLLNLLRLARQERDEARNQLQNFINKLTPQAHHHHHHHHPQFEITPIAAFAVKPNSNITDHQSNSLSDGYHQHHHLSHGCSFSPVDSFFDTLTSQDFSTTKMGSVNQQPNVISTVTNIDAVINDLAKGRTLPPKGKLLQAVMEAGPLLETLIVAGPVPKWRNPPPSLQTFKIPPVPIKGDCGSKSIINPKISSANHNRNIFQKRVNHCSASMLNFASSGFGHSQVLSTGAGVNAQFTGLKLRKVSMS